MDLDPRPSSPADLPPMGDFRGGVAVGRGRARVSLGFLVGSLLLFVAFHFLPVFGETLGWGIWRDLWWVARDPRSVDAQGAAAIAAFLSFAFLIVVSPFLGNVWRKSGWALWGTMVFSGLSGAVFWLMIYINLTENQERFVLDAGAWCLLGAPLLNFVGLFLACPRGGRSRGPDQVGADPR